MVTTFKFEIPRGSDKIIIGNLHSNDLIASIHHDQRWRLGFGSDVARPLIGNLHPKDPMVDIHCDQ
jgi:hypothetical protein